MPYPGALAAARSSRFRRSVSLSSGAGEVRVATGSPNSAKKRSRPAGRDGAQQSRLLARGVAEGVGRVGRDVDRIPDLQSQWWKVAQLDLDRARQHPEALLERVTVRGRPATRRDEHVEQRVAAGGVLTREQHGVGVAD